MNRKCNLNFASFFALVTLGHVNCSFAEQISAEQLMGTWSLTSFNTVAVDGNRTSVFGPHPQGLMMLTPEGQFSVVAFDANRPRWTSDRTKISVEELAFAAKGAIAQFGTWAFNEADQRLTLSVDAALNPSRVGTKQEQDVFVTGDDLTVTQVSSGTVGGGSIEQKFRRLK